MLPLIFDPLVVGASFKKGNALGIAKMAEVPRAADGHPAPPSLLKSAFVPPYALQGQEFSCHLTWGESLPLQRLELLLGADLEVVHLYNVKEFAPAKDQGPTTVVVTSVQEPGYLGFVLKSKVLPTAESKARVELKGEFGAGGVITAVSRSFEIDLFRPDLVVAGGEGIPRAIHFGAHEGGIAPMGDNPVILENRGKGTCIVLVSIPTSFVVSMGDYLQQGEAKSRFRKNLGEGLSKIRTEYPKYTELVGRIESFASKDLLTEDEVLEGVKDLNKQMAEVEKENPEFSEDLGNVFGEAALSILSVDQRFTSWATAFGSSFDRKIILLNPWFAVEVGPEPITVGFRLRCFDLQWHEHKQLSVGPLTLSGDAKGLVPVCGIFQAYAEREEDAKHKGGRGGHRKSG
jgi:hypothetical protein